MSIGVVESLPLERAEEGTGLPVILGGGMEDMVVEGRPAGRVGASRLVFKRLVCSLGRPKTEI